MREMDRVFSVEDISDGFWSPHAPPVFLHDDADVDQPSSTSAVGMNRSPSEWAFQRFLQEADSPDQIATATTTTTTTFPTDDVVKIKPNRNDTHHPPLNIPVNPEEYQALLKSRLELAFAAVALTRVFLFFFVLILSISFPGNR